MLSAFELQLLARTELARFRCALGGEHLQDAQALAYESGHAVTVQQTSSNASRY